MDNQAAIYQVTQETRKTGIASIKATLEFAGITSRTTLIAWERTGAFPKRVKLSGQRVGYRWSDLYKWADNLQAVEGQGTHNEQKKASPILSALVQGQW